MQLFGFHVDDIIELDEGFDRKCGYCNWETSVFYWLADSREEAIQGIKAILAFGGSPLCGDCMCELLVEEGYEITKQ
ncbi:hypothetical protein V4D30_01160 [Thermodesulfovibrio sp. 3907-1M]|uniref:Uncharacterized protein n=1 Tax=Thermodesulfovibrio autotrophicus TaxID=3118333 RepID=A0AAU8GWJ1_9BACT